MFQNSDLSEVSINIAEGYGGEILRVSCDIPMIIQNEVQGNTFRMDDDYLSEENEVTLLAKELIDGHNKYSILVVLTRFEDHIGNELTGYKYFWLSNSNDDESFDGVGTLLRWWSSSEINSPKYKLQDQFEWEKELQHFSQIFAKPCKYSDSYSVKNIDNIRNFVDNKISKIPFLAHEKKLKYSIFHTISVLLREKYNLPIAWAWNVGSMSSPKSFNVVHYYQAIYLEEIKSKIGTFTSLADLKSTNENQDVLLQNSRSQSRNGIRNYADFLGNRKVARFYFYCLSGIFSSLLGWFFSQFLTADLGRIIYQFGISFRPDFIILPLVSGCLSVAMVGTEILLSNPTHRKANQRIIPFYTKVALATGLVTGVISAILTFFLYNVQVPNWLIRLIVWGLIGFFIGLGESISWTFRSIEGTRKKAQKRILNSTLFGLLAGFTAAFLLELLRSFFKLQGWEDPVGFILLGCSLGIFLSISSSASYQVALRAGAGFEAIAPANDEDSLRYLDNTSYPHINKANSGIDFVTTYDNLNDDRIEEGLSIQLPVNNNSSIELLIGSSEKADIYLPKVAPKLANLVIQNNHVQICSLVKNKLQLQQRILPTHKYVSIHHNQIITLWHEDNQEDFYRFVFYDRFLDPEA